jgi:valyl-tRNA synthetase
MTWRYLARLHLLELALKVAIDQLVDRNASIVIGRGLAGVKEVKEKVAALAPQALVLVLETSEVVIPMASMFDLRSEMERITREMAEAVLEIGRLERLLGDRAFCDKAPAVVVEKQQEKLTGAREKLARLKEHKERLAG